MVQFLLLYLKHFTIVNFKIITILLFLTASFGHFKMAKAQTSFPKEIKKAFSVGDSKKLSAYFAQNVEILLIDKGDVYSKAQAALIMQNFFKNNRPKSFIIESESKDKSSNYAFAQLKTKKNNYRVFIAYQKKSKKFILNQMLISNN